MYSDATVLGLMRYHGNVHTIGTNQERHFGMKIRVKTRVKLFKNNEVVYDRTRSVVRGFIVELKGLPASEWDRGICRVTYNREMDYWNEFEFTNFEDFHNNLITDTEPDLIQTFA